jgi:uncharacterized pyridoxamine 5'-phosphate oxidase family protein
MELKSADQVMREALIKETLANLLLCAERQVDYFKRSFPDLPEGEFESIKGAYDFVSLTAELNFPDNIK